MKNALLDIVQAGVLAPSADNEHVFRAELLEAGIRLWPSAAFAAHAATDLLPRVLGLLSMGAVVENMRLRAGALGMTAQVRWAAGSGNQPIAQIDLQSAPVQLADPLAAAIPTRHSNRRMYHGPGLTEAETAQLNAAVAPVAGAQLIWLQGAPRRRALGLVWRAESERFLRKDLHHAIFSSVRFDLPWDQNAEWSLPPGALEIEPPMRPMFKLLRHWALMRPLTWLGVHRMLGLRAGWLPAWQAPALGLLVSTLPVEQGAVAVGAALERLWLQADALRLAMQPLAASAVLMQPSHDTDGASSALRATLAAGWQDIAPGMEPMMVVRMGRAAQPTLRSGRRAIEEYLSNETGM
jgi:hypothetical protein